MSTELLTSPANAAVVIESERDVLVDAIKAETGASTKKARLFFAWIDNVVDIIRARGFQSHYLTDDELAHYHDLMEAVMPDNQAPSPGSAHDLLERYVLEPGRDEFGLRHSKSENFNQSSPAYCTVEVHLNVI